jgi:hypothetical protein
MPAPLSTWQPVGLAFGHAGAAGKKPRLLPAATELMSEKAPQATFSN